MDKCIILEVGDFSQLIEVIILKHENIDEQN